MVSRKSPSIFLSFVICVSLLVCSNAAHASDTAAAETLFRSAREAAERGDWVTACDRFEESKRIEPAPGTVLNLARCREELGQVASAWKSYEEAAERLPAGDERAAFARARAEELAPRVPHVTLIAPETDEEFSVSIRGAEYSKATFGVPLPFDPGKLAITVRAPGRADSVFRTSLEEGESLEHRIQLGARAKTGDGESPASDEEARSGSGTRTAGIVLLSVGAAGVVTGTVGAILAAKEQAIVKDNCDEEGRCNRTGSDAAARGRTAVYLLSGGAAVAAIGLGLGTYLVLRPAPKTQVAFSPVWGGGMLELRRSL
jgi:hypothetical protein